MSLSWKRFGIETFLNVSPTPGSLLAPRVRPHPKRFAPTGRGEIAAAAQ